jgi:hypothetical protein
MEQCIYTKQEQCNGMLKDADLTNLVSIQSVPYEFNFKAKKERIKLSNEIKNKTQDCINQTAFNLNMEREDRLLNQLYNGKNKSDFYKEMKNTKCDCAICSGLKYSDQNRFQTAFYITRTDNWDIIDTLVKVSWYENINNKNMKLTKTFWLTDNKKCDYALFKNGNSKCCYVLEISNKNTKKVFYISNDIRFPEQFVNIMLDISGKNIKIKFTSPPSGEVCSLGMLKDDETMY